MRGVEIIAIIWTDGESFIIHKSKCPCGFCRSERENEYRIKRNAGWFRPRHTVSGQIKLRQGL